MYVFQDYWIFVNISHITGVKVLLDFLAFFFFYEIQGQRE